MARRSADPRFAATLRDLIGARGISYRALAGRSFYSKSYLHDLATGRKQPSVEAAARLDDILGAQGALTAMIGPAAMLDDETDAYELARRVAASDVSAETLTQLELAFDDLATSYAATPPAELLPRVRRHLAYIGQLVDARKTLAQHRRLLVVGWLSLLAATLHIDLRQAGAANAHLSASATLAGQAEHAEIHAWCLETRAWGVPTAGDYQGAVELSHRVQLIAPKGSSAQRTSRRPLRRAGRGRGWAIRGVRGRRWTGSPSWCPRWSGPIGLSNIIVTTQPKPTLIPPPRLHGQGTRLRRNTPA